MPGTRADLLVLGAGPTGLMVARDAARRGCTVVVVEAAPRVGGMAASFEVAGQRVDLGSHRLHGAMAPAQRAVVEALLGADLQERPRHGRMAIGGRLVAFPPEPVDLVRRLPLRTAVPFVRDAALGPWRRRGVAAPASFAEAVRQGLGPQALERFYGPYARKLWGVGADELSADLARRRVTANSGGAIARRLLRQVRGGATFFYPRLGFGQLVERLADDAVASGATIELGVRVEEVKAATTDVGLRVDDGRVLAGTTLVSTIPLPALVGLLDEVVPGHVRDAAASLETRGMALGYLVLDRDRYTPFDAHYLPGPETVVSRLSEPKNYRDGPDPSGTTVLCVEVPCSVGDELWSLADDALLARVADELAGVGLPLVRAVDGQVVRLPDVYPVHRIGAERTLATVESWSRTLPGVVTVGRQGLHTPDNTHHALAMGAAVVASLGPDGRIDAGRWAAARRRFDEHVVED